ncbi:acetolactate synthase-1/2/3 large subunit [Methylobacterium brachiatum]|uniref:Acetolactate synthase-1/2/3 large subunit n=1 Tax=Methylobacterium brachiatum TaxID=269660 RepID=A0AAJ1WYN6_9HYPH|nr:thiamine pyrophosphate-binding protein [Methylobacterium brachiatum]MCB4806434.1 thiamine pyrophosphate-binding protein [Methylobacterium brachiatum]MDQ0546672.1 acetolactate synthase-1/2/3 large subunit [Methylobacterium brachiatum]
MCTTQDYQAASVIARFLKNRGVQRVYGLCGGHIMPVWMAVDAVGIRIVDVRDERAAVHMAQGEAEVTGALGVALVTAGPGVTNAMTGIANAHISRAPILILSGTPPRDQENRGALQDLDHARLVGPITRYARTVREPGLIPQELAEAVARALGEGGDPGPAFLDVPTDVLRADVPAPLLLPELMRPRVLTRPRPDPEAVDHAVDLLVASKRPLIVSGRGARGAGPQLLALLDRLGCPYLDTGESRGLVPDDHPSVVAAMRGRAMAEADLVVTVGRRLDFQLAYGSPAVFSAAQFLRIAGAPAELRDNRPGTAILADPGETLMALVRGIEERDPLVDRVWVDALRVGHVARVDKLREQARAAPGGSDGLMHPNRLLDALQAVAGSEAIICTDGGDFLSFARVGLSARTVLDPGPFGCIGVGVPYGIAAALAEPERNVVVATGDGAFGFNAMELDTAQRHGAKVLFVVANNGAWQIEVHDQTVTHGRVVGTRLQHADHAAMARAFGLYAERVERADALPAALARAMANLPALLDVLVTGEAVSSDAKSGLAWVPDLQPLEAWDRAERAWRAG